MHLHTNQKQRIAEQWSASGKSAVVKKSHLFAGCFCRLIVVLTPPPALLNNLPTFSPLAQGRHTITVYPCSILSVFIRNSSQFSNVICPFSSIFNRSIAVIKMRCARSFGVISISACFSLFPFIQIHCSNFSRSTSYIRSCFSIIFFSFWIFNVINTARKQGVFFND
jgi:hypothetical protein